SRYRQNLSISIARSPGAHRGAKALPMPLAQPCRNYDVQRAAERFRLREAEDAGGTPVPPAYDALGIGIDDSIRHARNETIGELRCVNLHASSQPTAER